MNKTSIAVIGGGGVGLLTALSLQSFYSKVFLVTPSQFSPKVGELGHGLQTYTLSRSSIQYLSKWIDIESELTFFDWMSVSEEIGLSQLSWSSHEYALPYLGGVIQVNTLLNKLLEVVNTSDRIEVIEDKLLKFREKNSFKGSEVILTLASGIEIVVNQLFACDGAGSVVRQYLNPSLDRVSVGKALATVVLGSNELQKTAWQMFLKAGVLAIMPMKQFDSQCYYSVIFSQYSSNKDINHIDLSLLINRYSPIQVNAHDQILKFPLGRQIAREWSNGSTLFLLGDSARVILPLAGQGFNLGVADVQLLRSLLKAYPDHDYRLLAKIYQKNRRGQALFFDQILSSLNKGYEDEHIESVYLRNLGARWFDRCVSMKRLSVQIAQGGGLKD